MRMCMCVYMYQRICFNELFFSQLVVSVLNTLLFLLKDLLLILFLSFLQYLLQTLERYGVIRYLDTWTERIRIVRTR